MKINLYLFYFIHLLLFISSLESLDRLNEKLIISISSKFENLHNTNRVIESILRQNFNHSCYEIILILSKKEINNIQILPKSILLLEKYNKIRLKFINTRINLQTRLIVAIKNIQKIQF